MRLCGLLLAIFSFVITGQAGDRLDPSRTTPHTHLSGEQTMIEWYDAAHLPIEGRRWHDPDRPFVRLPSRVLDDVTPGVRNMSTRTAGLALRFETDSRHVYARWSGGLPLAMNHMAATGVSGLDLYRRGESGWEFVAVGFPTDRETTRTLTSRTTAVSDEYLLFLPLYSDVNYLEVGVDKGSLFRPLAPPAGEKPIVMYGTSIVQGGCASRTGMAHPAILRRWLDREVINLGFSGSARMEPIMADLLAEIDAAVYVLDCLPNMTDALVEERVEPFLRQLRDARPGVPIVFVEHLKGDRAASRHAISRAVIERLEAEGFGELYVIEGTSLLQGREEGTVDGTHPTDLGFLRIAEAHEPLLRQILEGQ